MMQLAQHIIGSISFLWLYWALSSCWILFLVFWVGEFFKPWTNYTINLLWVVVLKLLFLVLIQWVCQRKRKGWKSTRILAAAATSTSSTGIRRLCGLDLQGWGSNSGRRSNNWWRKDAYNGWCVERFHSVLYGNLYSFLIWPARANIYIWANLFSFLISHFFCFDLSSISVVSIIFFPNLLRTPMELGEGWRSCHKPENWDLTKLNSFHS